MARQRISVGVPDGGWGWVCIVGRFVMQLVLAGLDRSYGVLYIVLLERFGASHSITAWLGALHSALRLAGGLVASPLVLLYGERKVAILGAVLFSLGIGVSAFIPSIALLYLTYGVVGGLGAALMYTPAFIVTAKYFDKRLALVTGIASSGSGFGILTLPMLMSYCLTHYSYEGCLIIFSAIFLNGVVCGACYSPVEITKKLIYAENKSKTGLRTGKSDPDLPVPAKHANGTHKQQLSNGWHEQNNNCNGEHLPMIDRDVEKESLDNNHSDFQTSLPTSASKRKGTHGSNGHALLPTTDHRQENGRSLELNLAKSVTSVRSVKTAYSIMAEDVFMASRLTLCDHDTAHNQPPPKLFDFSLFQETEFVYLFIVGIIAMMGQPGASILLPDAVREAGVPVEKTPYLIGAIGVGDAVGRLSSGPIFDMDRVRPHRRLVWSLAIVTCGLSSGLVPFLGSFWQYVVAASVHGVMCGIMIGQRPTILCDIVGVDRIEYAFGLNVFCLGIGYLIGIPFSGALRDWSNGYLWSFIFLGSCNIFAGLIFPCYELCRYISKLVKKRTARPWNLTPDQPCEVPL